MSKKQLTTEEKKNNALVPEEEWPYKLPDNWCWVRGSMILRRMESQKPAGEYFQYIDIESVDNSRQEVIAPKLLPVSKAPSRASRKLHIGDTLFSLVRPYLMNIAYIDDSLAKCIASTGFYVCSPNKNMEPRYLYWLMVSPYTVDGLNNYMKGDNSPSIRGSDIENYAFPLPPLPEQQRIVSRIESLFVKLDEAKEKVQNVIDGADTRKAAILHQAFTGKLTAKWRKENSVTDDSWEKKTLQEVCCTKITDGTHKTPKYSTKEDGGIPFISAKDVTKGMICWDNIKYIVPELHEELYKRLAPQRDDVLLAKNGTTGVAAIVETDMIFDLYVTLAVLRPNKEKVYPRFLLNIVNSPICKRQFDEHLTGIGVPNLHLRDIKEIEIGLPKLPEQQEIVRLLDQFLDKEKSICESCEASLATIKTIKKSILAKAFRGELGTNNPAEESAKELLKKCFTTVV